MTKNWAKPRPLQPLPPLRPLRQCRGPGTEGLGIEEAEEQSQEELP